MGNVYLHTDALGVTWAVWDSSADGGLHVEACGSSPTAALAELARKLGELLEAAQPPQ